MIAIIITWLTTKEVAGWIVAVAAAITAIYKLLSFTAKKVAKWYTVQTKAIVEEVLETKTAPLLEAVHQNRESAKELARLQYAVSKEIQEVVSELLPNGGSHLRDSIEEMKELVKDMHENDKRNQS